MDGKDLLAALSGTQYRAAESPWGIAAGTLSGMAPQLVNPYGSTGSNIGISVGTSLLSALLAGMAQNDATSENARMAPILSDFMKGDDATRQKLVTQETRLSPLYTALMANELDNSLGIQRDVSKAQAMIPVKVAEADAMLDPELRKTTANKIFDLYGDLGQVPNPQGGEPIQIYDPIQRKVDEARQIEQAKQDIANEKPAELPAAMVTEIAKAKGVVNEAMTLGRALDKDNVTWKDLQGSKMFSGLDETGIGLQLKNLADRLARARSGAALNATEMATFDKMVGGDLSASPKQVAGLLKKLAEAETRFMKSQIDTALTVQKDPYGALLEQQQESDATQPPPGVQIPPGYVYDGVNPATGKTRIRPIGG